MRFPSFSLLVLPQPTPHRSSCYLFFFSPVGSPLTQALLFSLWSNPKTQAWISIQVGLRRRSWGVILESAWSVFLAGVETGEAGPLGWWSSERLGWVLAAVLWWDQIGVSLILFWVLIWLWDCVLVLQCKGGRWKESKAATVEEDDDREGSGVHGNEEVELEVELQKKNVWFVFVCVGVCHKVEEEMDFFFNFFIIFYYFGGWGLRLWSVVVVAVVVALGSGGSGCWQWVCW